MTGLLEEQLPVIMAADPNLVRFVGLVDPIATELYERVGDKAPLFHSATAPPPIVRWLAGLLMLPVADDVQLDIQRAVVAAAADAFPKRGTPESLRSVLSIIAQSRVEIEETGGVRCVPRPAIPARLAREVTVTSALEPPMSVRISVGPTNASEEDLRAVIERELRADAPYELTIERPQLEPSRGATA
jgi:phage tail-like protein